MAFTRLAKAVAALTFASSIRSVAAGSDSTTSVCSTSSKCVPFTVELTWGPTDATKGISRNAILGNGTVPAPPLYLKVGDCVDFVVINNLPDVTGVHFHGIRQNGTPWADGVPGLSQYGITPGTSFMYQWTAEDSGNYWYHSHYKGQMMDGLFGPIIIAPADDAQKPFSLISGAQADIDAMEKASLAVEPVMVNDWNRRTFSEFFTLEEEANVDLACADSINLNGFGSQYCPSVEFLTASAGPQEPLILNGSSLTAKGCVPPTNAVLQGGQFLKLQNLGALPDDIYNTCIGYSGQNYTYSVDAASGWAAMTFISSASVAITRVSIDSHKLYVYEWNGNYITPQVVDRITLANGERYTFFIKLDQTAGDYQIRVANAGINQIVSGFGVLSYKGGNKTPMGVAVQNYGGTNLTQTVEFIGPKAAPFPPSAPAAVADTSFLFNIDKSPSQNTSAWAWTLSGINSYNMSNDDTTPPLLFQNPANIPTSDLIIETQAETWVDLIIKIAGPIAEPHPIHKHANKFYMIGAGVGPFNFANVADAQAAGVPFNLQTPPYVDGFTSIPANGNSSWMVFRYQVNTYGAWIMHCHVQSHFSGGMAVAILDGVDKFPSSPQDVGQVCPGTGVSSYPNLSDNWSSGGGCWSQGGSGSSSSSSGSGYSSSSGSGSSSSSGSGSSTGTSSGSGSGSGSSTGTGSGTSTNNEGLSTTSSGPSVATFTGAASSLTSSSFVAMAFGLLALAFAL